jgi:hypothetical protein
VDSGYRGLHGCILLGEQVRGAWALIVQVVRLHSVWNQIFIGLPGASFAAVSSTIAENFFERCSWPPRLSHGDAGVPRAAEAHVPQFPAQSLL